MKALNEKITSLVFFDPQYEPVNKVCRKKDWPLAYQKDQEITQFIREIERILKKNGYLCLWINKKVLLECRVARWLNQTKQLKIVDFLIWKKNNFGLGHRFRNQAEFLLLIQKQPYQINFPDRSFSNVWAETIAKKSHPHQKPFQLLKRLIVTLTQEQELIVDPCAGSFAVFHACQATNRHFLGCDLTINKLQKFQAKKIKLYEKTTENF